MPTEMLLQDWLSGNRASLTDQATKTFMPLNDVAGPRSQIHRKILFVRNNYQVEPSDDIV
jgi:hypothetical protein